VLAASHQQWLRLATLQAANNRISNAEAEPLIFLHYSFDLETLYGSVDGHCEPRASLISTSNSARSIARVTRRRTRTA
jgi:hypothetical protein